MSETELLPKPKREPEPVRRLEVFTGAGRRRRWTAEQKARIVAEKISIATLIFRYFLRYFSSTHRADLSRFRGTFHSFDPVGFAIFAILGPVSEHPGTRAASNGRSGPATSPTRRRCGNGWR